MVLTRPLHWLRLSLWCTLASVIGGVLGYAIGYFLYQTIGIAIVEFYHLQEQFKTFEDGFLTYGAWIILIKGVTPIPYKLLTITAGVARLDIVQFMAASIVSRGLRFLLVSWVVHKFGPQVQEMIERRLQLFGLLFIAVMVLGIVMVKLL